jgi:hypothetical protein
MTRRLQPAAANPRLEAELAGWLRGLEPASMPIAARLRISADLQAEAALPRQVLTRMWRLVASTASLMLLLVGAGVFLLIVTGTGTALTGAGGPIAPLPGTISPTPGASTTPLLTDPLWVAVIVTFSILAGAITNLRPVRVAVARVVLGSTEDVSAPATPLSRHLGKAPRLALALAALPIIVVAWSTWLYWPSSQWLSISNLSAWISISLPACLACAIALRYPARDRWNRWLLIGGIAIAITTLPSLALGTAGELGWFDYSDWGVPLSMASPFVGYTLSAVGWTALAIGLATRAGRINRPRWFVVSAAIGAVGYTRVASALSFAAAIGLASQDVPRLVYQSASSVLIGLAWLSILWTALACSRRRGGRAWICLLVAAAAAVFLDAASFVATLTGNSFPSDFYLYLDWLSLGALLLALLVGLNPVAGAAAAGETPEPE